MLLWLLAVVLVIIGIVQLLQGQLLFALLLFVAAALVGPGGYQIGRGRRTCGVAGQGKVLRRGRVHRFGR